VHVGRVVHRGRVLTRARVPQTGATPMYLAAHQGHLEVVRALAEAGADKNAPHQVREARRGDVMLGAQRALVDLRARSWTGSFLELLY
jgi:predicted LPLAT superfamily acyltransferase